jgi:Zn-dependent protease
MNMMMMMMKKQERAPAGIFGCAAHGSRTSCALTGGRSDNFFLSFLSSSFSVSSYLLVLPSPR